MQPLPRPQTDLVWNTRDKWDMTMWRMVGRPERSDPDEFTYNLFNPDTAATGYNFVGYINPDYTRSRRRSAPSSTRRSARR